MCLENFLGQLAEHTDHWTSMALLLMPGDFVVGDIWTFPNPRKRKYDEHVENVGVLRVCDECLHWEETLPSSEGQTEREVRL